MATRAKAQEHLRVDEGASTGLWLVLLLLSVTGSVNAANWADGLQILPWAALGGLAIGVLFAKAPLHGAIAHFLMLVWGIVIVGSLATFLLPGGLTFEQKWILLEERLVTWAVTAIADGTSGDNLIFVVQVAFLAWTMGYVAAWFVYREHQVWGAILPAGAALLLNLFYAAPQSEIYLGLFVLSAMLLLVRMNLHSLEHWWRTTSVYYGGDIRFDFMQSGILFSILLIATAWLLPASAPGPSWLHTFDPLEEPWRGVEDQFNRVFGALRAVARPAAAAYFGTTLTLGGPVHLGQRPVMEVEANAGRYWRATVYDRYTGIGWLSTHLDAANLPAHDARLDDGQDLMRVEVTQTVKFLTPDQSLLYAQAQPIQFSIPVQVRYGQPRSGGTPTPPDVALILSQHPLGENETYQVVSLISVADEDSLRSAPTTYSSWITSNYLQLPNDLPERVRTLAEEITAPYSNPYDKAAAIEQYLRTHIRYNDSVSAPPDGRDSVDYTLFDRPEGYCNYYASAMAVLGRAAGIPVRVASGYSLGSYKDGAFHIVEANAHAWPEVYFPDYGWIEFEPTASRPEIDRSHKAASDPASGISDEVSPTRRGRPPERGLEGVDLGFGAGQWSPFQSAFWREPRNLVFAGGGLAMALTGGTLYVVRRRRRSNRPAPAARAYADILKHARWLGVRDQGYSTPFERARVIGEALPRARTEIETIISYYVREKYGRKELDGAEKTLLLEAWNKVHTAWRQRLVFLAIGRAAARPRSLARRMRRVLHRSGQS
jgi:transglutaminase-like putative cysteine protease